MKRVVSVVLFLVMGMGVKAQAPTNVNAGLENGHFVLKWDAVEGAVHYQVYHKEATMPFRLVADTEDTNISDNAYYRKWIRINYCIQKICYYILANKIYKYCF